MVSFRGVLLFVLLSGIRATREAVLVDGASNATSGKENGGGGGAAFGTHLCDEAALTKAWGVLGNQAPAGDSPQGNVAQLQDVLTLSAEEVQGALTALDLKPDDDLYSLKDLCEACVIGIPKLLHEVIPQEPQVCLVGTEEIAIVAESSMSHWKSTVPLVKPMTVQKESIEARTIPTAQPKDVVRSILGVLFGIFPTPEQLKGLMLLQTSFQNKGNKSAFGPGLDEVQTDLLKAVAQASSFVASAIGAVSKKGALVKQWFLLEGAPVKHRKAQFAETKKVLNMMLKALSMVMFKRGEDECTGLAYVPQASCTAFEQECGEKEGKHYVVYMCGDFFELDAEDQAFVLIHVITHHFGAQEIAGDYEGALALSPEEARLNSGTYEHLVRSLTLAANKFLVQRDGEKAVQLKQKLDALVGLASLKKEMQTTLSLVDFSSLRETANLGAFAGQSLHMSFQGNPGTGKTVVARIVGELMVSMGGIQAAADGQFKWREASRSDLVGEYKGETAMKVQKLVKESFGGVLFIDEAYALVQDSKDNFGREAVDTLIKEMEDHRDKLVVVLAGYTKEMKDFLSSNPGFESRVPFKFEFEDYTCEELVEIAKIQMKGKDALLDAAGHDQPGSTAWWLKQTAHLMTQCCWEGQECSKDEDRTNGNGRTMRNILESTYRQTATRVLRTMDKDAVRAVLGAVEAASGKVPEPDCESGELDFGGYQGPDVRCAFKLLHASDVAIAATILLNTNLKACGISADPEDTAKLADDPGTWGELAKQLAIISELRTEGGEELDNACGVVFQLMPAKGSFIQRGSNSAGSKLPDGFQKLDKKGYCAGDNHKSITTYAEEKDLSIDECAQQCLEEPECTGFAYLGLSYKLCRRYRVTLPKYAIGRPTVTCYLKKGAKGGKVGGPAKKGKATPSVASRGKAHRKAAAPAAPRKAVPEVQIVLGDSTDSDEETPAEVDVLEAFNPKADEYMEELKGMEGLMRVKQGINELKSMVEFDGLRSKLLPDSKSILGGSYHMQFLGNPGTGKTHVARIVGKILTAIGVIEKDAPQAPAKPDEKDKGPKKAAHVNYGMMIDQAGKADSQGKEEEEEDVFVEVSRADLVAQFVGHTAPKVSSMVNKAKGGVLFIDEAYSLKKNRGDAFGQEAVDTLIKEIEDNRGQVIAIFAGYEKEMQQFFDSNPGFKSRVPFTFYFDDYACEELMSIAEMQLKGKSFTPEPEARVWIDRNVRFSTGCCPKGEECEARRDNGNGRTVRNVLEASYRNFAARIAPQVYKGVSRKILDYAAELQKIKETKVAEYAETGYGWRKRLEKDHGYTVYCGPEEVEGKSRKDHCADIKNNLKTLVAADTALAVSSTIAERLSMPCHEAHINIGEIEDLARKNLLSMTEDQWVEVATSMNDGDCQKVKMLMLKIRGSKGTLLASALDIMAQDPEMAPVLSQLSALEGLAKVKETMGQLYGTARLASWRKLLHMKSVSGQSFHMRFLGNPGTGKTVVARIVGEMLVRMGVVAMPKGRAKVVEQVIPDPEAEEEEEEEKLDLRFKEAARPDLVASHSGQTAPKVKKLVEQAEGGVLFIDEAYSIVRASGDSFGKEAVDTLIKEMEDKRSTVVVILAGYDVEMESFFEANPGFKSRVPITFRFQDYDCSALERIAQMKFKKMGVQTEEAYGDVNIYSVLAFATGCCEDLHRDDCVTTRDNGNGRTVRNVVEAMSRAMARRVMKQYPSGTVLPKEALQNLQPPDVETVAGQQAELRLNLVCKEGGMLTELNKALSGEVGALNEWFRQWKLANPVTQIHKFLREFARLSLLKSDFLTDLQDTCQNGVTAFIGKLDAKARALCGSGGALEALDAKVADKTTITVKGFGEFMQSVDDAVQEANNIRKFFEAEDVPAPLNDYEEIDGVCEGMVTQILSRSLPVNLRGLLASGASLEDEECNSEE